MHISIATAGVCAKHLHGDTPDNDTVGKSVSPLCMQVWIGTFYTGPLMNPAVALAWNTTLGGVDDHWLLYVAAPFIGAALAVPIYMQVCAAGCNTLPSKGTAFLKPLACYPRLLPVEIARGLVC